MFPIMATKIRGEWTKVELEFLIFLCHFRIKAQATFAPDIAAADISELPETLGKPHHGRDYWNTGESTGKNRQHVAALIAGLCDSFWKCKEG
jgi:hypothetical protein